MVKEETKQEDTVIEQGTGEGLEEERAAEKGLLGEEFKEQRNLHRSDLGKSYTGQTSVESISNPSYLD